MGRMTPDGAPGQEQRDVARKIDNRCFEKARSRNQMTFTVVEQDITAPYTILEWIRLNWATAPVEKLRDAFENALAMQHSEIEKKHAD
jgi:hypothetical protein